ncbi:MAG: sulfatase [Balneolaceae bacterium]|nr:sulfatase [Balneolaceae bacterium]
MPDYLPINAKRWNGWLVLTLCIILGSCQTRSQPEQPNIVILFTDDMGYGDLGSYGHPTIRTPNIDALADQGIRFTSFVTGAWCVPSRTQLLTGRYMPRVRFGGSTGSDGKGGLPDSELTLAEALSEAGYVTGMAGKWHLGYKQNKFLPPNQGFDTWFGLPYSNDYRKPWVQTEEPLALFRDTTIVEHPIDQNTLTTRYTEEAVQFIQTHSATGRPFFFYLAYNMPHLPIHTAERFRGQSRAGLYGDVIETIDWSVGQVLEALEEQGVAENTILFFASDNGPWLNLPERMLQEGNEPWHAGSPGLLRGSKATSYEGGARVPAIIRWPGRIAAGTVTDEPAASPDIYHTLIEAAGATLPSHPVDGYDLLPFLTGESPQSPREEYAYFLYGRLEAMRVGRWKVRMAGGETQLFDLQVDPGERFNRAADHPAIVREIRGKMADLAEEVGAEMPGANSD